MTVESEWGITRWQVTDPQYVETVKYIETRRYHRALGKLQRLVIQRLFELHKLNLAQTGICYLLALHAAELSFRAGYKVRTHLAKSLQRRCKAIRNAVREYNAAASALDVPRPKVDWSKVSHFSFLEQFALLRDTRNDLSNKPWARPEIREVMRISRRIDRAREEIANVNREARRLHTHIRDEEILFRKTLIELKARGDPLHGALDEYCRHRRAMNARNMAYLEALYQIPGFTGDPTPGRRAGTTGELAADSGLASNRDELAEEDVDDSSDDALCGEASAIYEYLAGLFA